MDTCKTCPSFVPAEKTEEVFGRDLGAPMCARYGYVLGKADLSDKGHEKLQESFALQCDSYGAERPEKPLDSRANVVHPDLKVIQKVAEPSFKPSELRSCTSCSNCVTAGAVQSELGYPLPLCRAFGKLLFQPRRECSDCPSAMEGAQSTTTAGMELRAEFKEGYSVPVELAVKKLIGNSNSQQEPTTYKSDKELSTYDVEDGIRAWRKVTDPSGSGNVVYLPIFSPNKFTDEQRALIPQTGDDEHPETYIDYSGLLYSFVVESFELDETLCIQGAPGLGKTEFSRWVAWLMQVPFRRFSFTSSSEVDDMIGKMMYAPDKGTYFQWGRIPKAYAECGVLVCDELNLAEPPLREALRPAFDNNKQLVLDASKGEIVTRNQYCFFIVAQNPAWDMRNLGAVEMADADYNRLSVISVDFPPETVERHIVIERCKFDGYAISDATLTTLEAIARDLREAASQGTIPFTWGTRQQIKVARKTRYYTLIDAFKRSAVDFYDPQTHEQVLQIVRDHAGE